MADAATSNGEVVATEQPVAAPANEAAPTSETQPDSAAASSEQLPEAHCPSVEEKTPPNVEETSSSEEESADAAPGDDGQEDKKDTALTSTATSWIAGIASSIGFGGGDASSSGKDKRDSTGDAAAESEDDPEVVVVVPDTDEGKKPSSGGRSGKLAQLSPSILQRRKESVAAEMKAFLEDSDEEAAEAEAQAEADARAEANAQAKTSTTDAGATGRKGAMDSASASAVDVSLSPSPSTVIPPRTPRDDTEFSAGHAKRVIGSGVVLERKASISAGNVRELKNKSQFSAEDAAATISAGAISERTRKLREEQEALRRKHATERQDTDLAAISAEMKKAGSIRGKYNQALGGSAEKMPKAPTPSGRLNGDWTQRRESLEKFVVTYDAPDNPSAATGAADAPTRYIPLPPDPANSQTSKLRANSGGPLKQATGTGDDGAAAEEAERTAAGSVDNAGASGVPGQLEASGGRTTTDTGLAKGSDDIDGDVEGAGDTRTPQNAGESAANTAARASGLTDGKREQDRTGENEAVPSLMEASASVSGSASEAPRRTKGVTPDGNPPVPQEATSTPAAAHSDQKPSLTSGGAHAAPAPSRDDSAPIGRSGACCSIS